MYLATCAIPDIAAAVGQLARCMSQTSKLHWSAAKHVLRYLEGKKGSHWHVFVLNGAAVSWKIKLQSVALSTAEAEYNMPLCETVIIMTTQHCPQHMHSRIHVCKFMYMCMYLLPTSATPDSVIALSVSCVSLVPLSVSSWTEYRRFLTTEPNCKRNEAQVHVAQLASAYYSTCKHWNWGDLESQRALTCSVLSIPMALLKARGIQNHLDNNSLVS